MLIKSCLCVKYISSLTVWLQANICLSLSQQHAAAALASCGQLQPTSFTEAFCRAQQGAWNRPYLLVSIFVWADECVCGHLSEVHYFKLVTQDGLYRDKEALLSHSSCTDPRKFKTFELPQLVISLAEKTLL